MPPILDNKRAAAPSVFRAGALLREARRQKGLPDAAGPSICVLDPDGDIVRHLRSTGQASRCETWPCYHTQLDTFMLGDQPVGIVGCAVGAPFAVLVAEELFASGCRFLLSLTSAGQISAIRPPPYFVIIDRALRDEGTSYHYASAADYAEADPTWVALARRAVAEAGLEAIVGATWTTDAPFRETADAIAAAKGKGMLGVEMEAAALYAFARASGSAVLCLAHVTNTMGQTLHDFEKGARDGTQEALALLAAIVAHAGRHILNTAPAV